MRENKQFSEQLKTSEFENRVSVSQPKTGEYKTE